MSKEKSQGMSGTSLLAVLLTVLFVGLKLTHYIDWSWIWVLSPLWIGVAVVLFFLFLYIIIKVIGSK